LIITKISSYSQFLPQQRNANDAVTYQAVKLVVGGEEWFFGFCLHITSYHRPFTKSTNCCSSNIHFCMPLVFITQKLNYWCARAYILHMITFQYGSRHPKYPR